jgi:putative hydrolase
MFSQPGAVNLDLAREISRHLSGDLVPLNPWTTEELIELVRLAEYQIAQIAPFSFPPASAVTPVGPREWGDAMVEELASLAEPFASQMKTSTQDQQWAMLAPLGPVLAGAQLGAWTGLMATRVIGSCETGLPTVSSNRTLLVAPALEELSGELSVDGRQVRMWAALFETAHRAVFALPHILDSYRELNEEHASTVKLVPESLMEQLGSITDPSAIFNLDLDMQETGLLDSTDSGPAREKVDAFLGVTGAMSRRLVRKAGSQLIPDLDNIVAERGFSLDLDERTKQASMMVMASDEAIENGSCFLEEVEERFGSVAAQRIWQPEGFPTADEVNDPVGWAARVLLDDSLW